MSFLEVFENTDIDAVRQTILSATAAEVLPVLKKTQLSVDDFPVLISPAAEPFLEQLAEAARRITLLRFGKTMKLYAPLYVSNECVNACAYCGFNTTNKLERVTLTKEDILREADVLHRQGMRHILLVSGEHPGKVPVSFLADIADTLAQKFAGISIEVYPMDTDDYRILAGNGVTGIAVYQETYDRDLYARLHKGPKADYEYRLATPERAAAAGFRELGIGSLLGLTDFRTELACVALHAAWLMKKFWKSQLAISFPRMRRAEGAFTPPVQVSDKQLAQAICALRMVLPDADLVLSTREHSRFRDGMAGLGVTRMSAGSKTQPGGYEVSPDELEQFTVADTRSTAEIADMLAAKGLEPVWKDFDRSFLYTE